MKAYFISDLHIKLEDKAKGLKLIEFLQNLPQDTTHLVLLGDVFDLWIGSHKYFIKKFPKIIAEFKKLLDRNVEIHYFEGNHDLHLSEFWGKQMGMFIHSDEYFFNLEGFVIRAEHGDLMNADDKSYLFLRKALRSFPINVLATRLPGKIVEVIGDRSSRVSRFYNERINQEYKNKVKRITRDYAKKVYEEEPFDLIVTGHTHVEDDFSFQEGSRSVRSVNLGTWLDKPRAFVITKDEKKFIDL